MTAPNDDILRVREANPIERVVGEVVNLKSKGRELVGLCPFHDDHKPSMNVIPAKGIFHCFVCGTGGNVYTFVQKYHSMDFGEAIRYLAEKANIKLTPFRPRGSSGGESHDSDGPRTSRQDLLFANAFAASFFQKILSLDHGAAARAIIEKRGIVPSAVSGFAVGAGPDRWDGLLLAIQAAKLDIQPFVDAGLLKRRETGDGYYDSFRNRLMFPILDKTARVVAFGGRIINPDDTPKYLNSPESPLFNKSATLYALPQARALAMKSRRIVVVEGYMDVIACHQAGFTNVVATLGTALTIQHARELRLIADEIVLLFDGDDAGQKAADRAFDVFFKESIDVSIATLARVTDAKDPDELLKREGGKELLTRALAESTPLLKYRYQRLREKVKGAGPAALERALREDLGKLAELGWNDAHPTRKQLILRQLAEVTGLSTQAILAAMPKGRDASRYEKADAPVEISDHARTFSAAEHVLGCILNSGNLWIELKPLEQDGLLQHEYNSEFIRPIVEAIRDLAEDGDNPVLGTVLTHLHQTESAQTAVSLARRVEILTDNDAERLAALFADTRKRLAAETPAEVSADPMEKIKQLRQQRQTTGRDPRRTPRPS